MKIQLAYDDSPDDCVHKINELLKEHNLVIEISEDFDPDEDDTGCIPYEILTLKNKPDANI